MASYNKAPPSLSKNDNYETWKKKLVMWQKLTSFEKKKQGPALVLSLDDESQEAVLDLTEEVISAEDGVTKILEVLDKLYLKDKTQSAFEALEDFESYRRPKGLSMSDYCNEFDKKYAKVKSYGTEFPKDLLGFRLLKSANLLPHQEQLAKATITELTYDNMKTQLKKTHGSVSSTDASGIKNDVDGEIDLVEADVLYGSMSSGRGNRFQRGHNGRGYSRSYRGGQSRPYRGNQSMKGRNPPDMYGNTSKCAVCGSVNHWAKNCPDVAKKDSSTLHCEHNKCEKQEKKETLNVINIIMWRILIIIKLFFNRILMNLLA